MTSPRTRSLGERIYAVLLKLLPHPFRVAFEDELVSAFSHRYRQRSSGRVRLWIFHLSDLARSALREHREYFQQRRARWPRSSGDIMNSFLHDVRYALRGMRRNVGFATVVILTLTLGIGMNTVMYTMVHGVLMSPLPFPDADRLVWGTSSFSGGTGAAVSPPDFVDYRQQNSTFEVLAARRGTSSRALTGSGQPEQIISQVVTAGFFEALGAVPSLGRTFSREHETEVLNNVVVLSHGFWQRRFGADRAVLGQVITLDGTPREIIGVAPAGFRLFLQPDVWEPLALDGTSNQVRRFHNLRVVARLASGVTIDMAQADLDVISQQLALAYPESNATWRLVLTSLHTIATGGTRTPLLIMFGAVFLVLLISIANVASLMLARATARRSEMALRTALGAGNGRLVRQLMTESSVYAAIGGGLGVVTAVVGVQWLTRLPALASPLQETTIDWAVLGFALLLSLGTGFAFGLAPAMTVSRASTAEQLRGARTGRIAEGRLRAGLVSGEVGLALILLIGAGLLTQSFMRLNQVHPGFDVQNLLTARMDVPPAQFASTEERHGYLNRLIERVDAVPGVASTAVVSHLPMAGSANDTYLAVSGVHQLGTESQFNAQTRWVSPNYFDVMGIPVTQGRGFSDQDHAGAAKVIVINEPFRQTIFPDDDPIGRMVQIDLGDVVEAEIVGVVGGVNHFGLANAPPVEFYMPFVQHQTAPPNFVIRTSIAPEALARSIPAAVWELNPNQVVGAIDPYTDLIATNMSNVRGQVVLLTIFASIALMLASIGIYGVVRYHVAQQMREVSVRVALGARPSQVYRMVIGKSLIFTGIGVAVGLVGAWALTRFLSGILYNVHPRHLGTFAGVSVVLGLVAIAASALPARQAAHANPVNALRE